MGTDRYESHRHDVLVIGAGGAGLRAAIEASARGADVGLVCKSLLGKAHTVMAEGGMAAALANVRTEDDWKVHFRDTMRGGKMLNQWRMAQLHAQEAPDRARELERWGAVFDRTPDGKINQRPFGGHTYARLAHVGDRTGLEMIRTLQDHAIHRGMEVYMECTVFRLLKQDDHIAGAIAYWRESGKFVVFQAKTIILATGGIGKSYQVTSNSWEYTGDGHTLAADAGADLMDMEFVQFHPTGMVWPLSVKGILVTEAVRGEGGVLRNSEGERFMFRNVPEMFQGEYAETEEEAKRWVLGDRTQNRRPPELLTRDVVARAIVKEVQEGRASEHGGAYLDIASQRSAEDIKKRLPSMYHQFRELADVDITQEPMEVYPTTHYAMGGVRVDPDTQESTVPGLYAAGEVSGGMHGANRLGGNSLSDLLVFGRRAGLHAAEAAAEISEYPSLDEAEVAGAIADALAPLENAEGENPYTLQQELQKVMNDRVGIAREEKGLQAAIEEIRELRKRAQDLSVEGTLQYNPGWHLAIDVHSLLTVSEAIARSALERRESRGAHTRIDYEGTSDDYGRKNVVVRREGEDLAARTEPLPAMPPELQELFEKGKQ